MPNLEDITGLIENVRGELSLDNVGAYRSNIHSSIRRLLMLLAESFHGMEKEFDPLDLEKLASVVHQVMSAKYRKYHNLNHIFSTASEELPAYAKVAIVFHDLVYLQVDRRIHPLISTYLKDFNLKADTQYECILHNLETDPVLQMIGNIFSFKTGQKITLKSGLNEFLSAVVACRMLPEVFSTWELVKIVACIEATIPFRPLNEKGESPLDQLAKRIVKMDFGANPKPDRDQVDSLVTVAMKVAIADLEGFFSMDLGYFLAQTWDLILETNPLFRNPLYTVRQYRLALQKVLSFYKSLNPDLVPPRFSYAHSINEEEQSNRSWWAKINIETGCMYLEAKILSTAILEAIAELSGGDTSIALILGESPDNQASPKAPVEYYLDYTIPEDHDGIRINVHSVLAYGREKPSGFDFKHSPLSTFLYERLRDKAKAEIIQRANTMFSGDGKALELLKAVPKPLLATIIDAVSVISWTRRDALILLKEELGLPSSTKKVA